jgi:hypothetical protein
VPKGKSDVYVSSRRLGNSVKVSLHEPGPARFALTKEFVEKGTYQAPEGFDPRLAVEWERPRPNEPPLHRRGRGRAFQHGGQARRHDPAP